MQLEQGRGSATTALMLSQSGFDIAHLNTTNAAQMISKGGAIKMVGIYQHKTAAAFIGIKGKVKLDGPQSLKGIKIGSTPAARTGSACKVFTAANKMKLTDLNIVALDANAKTAALFSGTIDAVSGDAPAFDAYVRATNQQPETMLLQRLRRPADRLRLRRQQRLPREEPGGGRRSSSPPPSAVSPRRRATTRQPAS